MTFGVLGPLELRVGDVPWELRGGRERMLLALLLTAPGRVLSASSLAAGLWGESPRRGAEKTVQTYVSRLRATLPEHGAGLLLTRSPGYLLAVAPDQVDAERFRRLAAAGREQLGDGEAATACATLRKALDLWRGEAYMEFDAPFATLARTALDEERLAAHSDLLEAELASGQGADLVGELEALVAQHPWRERLWAQLMVALYRSGRQSEALLAYQRARTELRDELGVDPGPELRGIEEMVLAHDPRLSAPLTPWSGTVPPPSSHSGDGRVVGHPVMCPFKGLAHYEVDDAPYFFGRSRLVDRLVARMVDRPLLAVVGPSGSGKSSVLRAGLVARIGAGVLPGSEHWHVRISHPAAGARPQVPEGRTLLVIDALEEMFTALGPAEQASYAAWVCAAASSPDVSVVVALRADHFGLLTAQPELVELVELVAANTVPVGPLSREELREAVEGPLAAARLSVEAGLVDLVVDDVAGQPGALPLLSAALLSLWEGREGDRLTLAAYQELGGVRRAVAQLGERFYAQLPRDRRGIARRVLVRLADTSAGGQPVRRRVPAAELGVDADPDVRAVVDALAAGRLVTLSETHVEVAHEALLQQWPRLRTWLEEAEVGERLRRQLAPHVADWEASGRPDSELYRGHRLVSALDWLAEHPDDLTTRETAFLRASEEATLTAVAERRRSVRRLRTLVGTLAGALVLAAVLGGFALSERNQARSSAAAARDAELAADVRALRAEALAEPRIARALLLSASAYRMEPSAASRSTMLEVAQRSPELESVHLTDQRLQHVAISADGDTVAAVGSEGGVFVWATSTGELVTSLPQLTYFGATSLDLSPDGDQLVLVGIPTAADLDDTTVKGQAVVVDLTVRRPQARTLAGPALAAARFAADGRQLVELRVDGRVQVVRTATGEVLPAPEVEAAATQVRIEETALEVSPGGRYFVVTHRGRSGPVTVWASATGKVLLSERQRGGTVAAVSPDGEAVVLGHADGTMELADVASGALRPVSAGLTGGVTDLAWSPGGGEFAGSSANGTVTTWDADSLAATRVLHGHAGGAQSVGYAPDGTRLWAAGDDGTVLAWRLTGRSGLVRTVGGEAPGALGSVMASDGSLVVSGLQGDVVRLFDVTRSATRRVALEAGGAPAGMFVAPEGPFVGYLSSGWPDAATLAIQVIDVRRGERMPYVVELEPGSAFDARFSGDGRVLVTADDDVVELRDVRTGRRLGGTAPYGARDPVAYLGVDHDAGRLALMETSGQIEVVDTERAVRIATLDPTPDSDLSGSSFQHLTFSPDGRWLAAGADGGAVVVWDTRSWEVHAAWTVVGGSVQSIAFSEDSRSIVVGGGGTASIRVVDDPQTTAATIDLDPLRTGGSVSAGSREDGRVMVTHTDHSGVQLWRIAPEALLAHACRVAGRDLTREEWESALPDRPYAPTC